jgi:hypothetical protein
MLLPGLARRATLVEAIDEGYRLHFAATADIVQAITRVIDAERHCCRFLTFQVTVTADGGPVVLTVTGPTGTTEFLADLFAAC